MISQHFRARHTPGVTPEQARDVVRAQYWSVPGTAGWARPGIGVPGPRAYAQGRCFTAVATESRPARPASAIVARRTCCRLRTQVSRAASVAEAAVSLHAVARRRCNPGASRTPSTYPVQCHSLGAVAGAAGPGAPEHRRDQPVCFKIGPFGYRLDMRGDCRVARIRGHTTVIGPTARRHDGRRAPRGASPR